MMLYFTSNSKFTNDELLPCPSQSIGQATMVGLLQHSISGTIEPQAFPLVKQAIDQKAMSRQFRIFLN